MPTMLPCRAFSFIAANGFAHLTCGGSGGCFLKTRMSLTSGSLQDYSSYTSGVLHNNTGADSHIFLALPCHVQQSVASLSKGTGVSCTHSAPSEHVHLSLHLSKANTTCLPCLPTATVVSYPAPGTDYDVAGSPLPGLPATGMCPISTLSQQECAVRCASVAGCVGYVYTTISTQAPDQSTYSPTMSPSPFTQPYDPSQQSCPGGCRLKGAWGPALYRGANSGWYAALMSPVAYHAWPGFYFYGAVLAAQPGGCASNGSASVDACAQVCKDTADCE